MELDKGTVFGGKYFKGKVKVLSVDNDNNILSVELTLPLNCKDESGNERFSIWCENWNLEHTIWGIEGGDYYEKDFSNYPV